MLTYPGPWTICMRLPSLAPGIRGIRSWFNRMHRSLNGRFSWLSNSCPLFLATRSAFLFRASGSIGGTTPSGPMISEVRLLAPNLTLVRSKPYNSRSYRTSCGFAAPRLPSSPTSPWRARLASSANSWSV